jgi:hypothetical protein
MAIILFDDNAHQTLLPLTYTRPVADLRIGIMTIAEKWAKHLNTSIHFIRLIICRLSFRQKLRLIICLSMALFAPMRVYWSY